MIADREFDLVLLGPTGYTGQLCIEHIANTFPTKFRWALAGRSASKIQSTLKSLKGLNSGYTEPGEHYSNNSKIRHISV
jgi:short subunit dehydrogenase-like uncharacterized protein